MSTDIRENLPDPIEDWFPGQPIPARAAELLKLVGLSPTTESS